VIVGDTVRMRASAKLKDHSLGVIVWKEITTYADSVQSKVGVRWIGSDGGPDKIVDHYPHELEVVE